jgi:UDP-N-acetylglucosamine--N-acetylmuramyl-(pentapeptide) pyrophosphoryl-undecaprenol N-acetylglucosamine transferase
LTTIVIAAGGTGGHLYPAVALAREFLRRDPAARILFVGTSRGIEAKVLAHEGFELALISAQPVMGRNVFRAALALLLLPVGVRQSLSLLRVWKANLVLGIGGYTSPPVLLAARLLGLPRAILEPNATPGMANKVLAPLVQRVFVTFGSAAQHFSPATVRVTGMPIRREFFDSRNASSPEPRASSLQGRQTLLIFGGSQGARVINDAMIAALPHLASWKGRLAIVHQTGEADRARVAAAYEQAGMPAQVTPFLFDMPAVLRGADLVVSRAGAMTVAELTICGKPAVLVPLPTAIYQHQARNAQALAEAGGAVVLPQSELTGAKLAETVTGLLGDPNRLRAMGERSLAMGKADAVDTIVRECLQLVRGKA